MSLLLALSEVPAPVVAAQTPQLIGRGRRKFVEIDGRVIPVDGYEEALRLILLHRKERAAEEKQIKWLFKKYQVATPAKQEPIAKKIEVLEMKVDLRSQIIADIYQKIDKNMKFIDEEESLIILLQ